MFLNKSTDQSNCDLAGGKDLNYYLNLTKDYKHDISFTVKAIDGYKVIDDGEFEFGTKAKMADFFISQVQEDALVYVAPRTGYAPFSLCHLAKKYNKKLSEKRALAAKDYIVSKGIDQKLIFWEGKGPKQPIPVTKFCDNKMNRKQLIECLGPNRRVTVEVVGTADPQPKPAAKPEAKPAAKPKP